MENTGTIKITIPQAAATPKAPAEQQQTDFQAPNPRATYLDAMKQVEGVRKQHTPVINRKGIRGELDKIGRRLNLLA